MLLKGLPPTREAALKEPDAGHRVGCDEKLDRRHFIRPQSREVRNLPHHVY